MKNLILIFLLGMFVRFGIAQNVNEANVPPAVKAKFASLYPDVKSPKWTTENRNFEAEFDMNKVETSVLFDTRGTLLETEIEIPVNDLPKPAIDYVAKNVPAQKIKEASKITDAKGVVTYEAELTAGDLIFDANGKFIKREVEPADKDNDKEKKEKK